MRLTVGVGARTGVAAADLESFIAAVLARAGLAPGDVLALATLDRRAAEPGVAEVARRHGWRLIGYSADELASEAVPTPSTRAHAAVGTPSVAEAAALRAARAAGADARLVVPKRAAAAATVAIAACGRCGASAAARPPAGRGQQHEGNHR